MLLKTAQESAVKFNKKIAKMEVVQPEGVDFKAYHDAEHILTKEGFSVNLMRDNNPVSFYKDNEIAGTIISDSTFKKGSVAIVYFK